jgi:hypothetical protein
MCSARTRRRRCARRLRSEWMSWLFDACVWSADDCWVRGAKADEERPGEGQTRQENHGRRREFPAECEIAVYGSGGVCILTQRSILNCASNKWLPEHSQRIRTPARTVPSTTATTPAGRGTAVHVKITIGIAPAAPQETALPQGHFHGGDETGIAVQCESHTQGVFETRGGSSGTADAATATAAGCGTRAAGNRQVSAPR